jgi:hypothetical protein
MDDPLERAREFLERRTSIAMLATVTPEGVPETCLLIAPRFGEDGTLAGGEERDVSASVFRNLRLNPRATILVLDPIMDPRARDGSRLQVEFLGAEQDGDDLATISQWLSSFAPGREVVRRLLFKILSVEHFRPRDLGPVLLP